MLDKSEKRARTVETMRKISKAVWADPDKRARIQKGLYAGHEKAWGNPESRARTLAILASGRAKAWSNAANRAKRIAKRKTEKNVNPENRSLDRDMEFDDVDMLTDIM